MIRKQYQILDVGFIFETNSEEFLAEFDSDFSPFVVENRSVSDWLAIRYEDKGIPGEEELHINGVRQNLPDCPGPTSMAYHKVILRLMQEFRRYIVLHAGVVANSETCLIIAGPACSGKTSLTMKLIEWGLLFLSDEFCPIHLDTGMVHPFPRNPRFQTYPESLLAQGGSTWQALSSTPKVRLNIRNLGCHIATTPYRVGALICLDPNFADDPYCQLRILPKREVAHDFLLTLGQLPGVEVTPVDSRSVEWEIRYPRERGYSKVIREFLVEHDQEIGLAYRVNNFTPDFSAKPLLQSIPRHQAILSLMKELKQDFLNGSKLHTLKPGMILAKLYEILKDVPCYRLTVGDIESMVRLTLTTLNGGEEQCVAQSLA